jgi:1-pyrroline-5-carboxylate dehydrogenase
MSSSGNPGTNAVPVTWPDEVTAARGEFSNTAFIDFSNEENAAAMRAALEKVRSELGQTYPLILGGKEVMTEARIVSINPANPSEIVGTFAKAGREEAEMAINVATETFETWKWTDPRTRAEYAWKAADLMTERRLELAAWMVYETSKSWPEADGDVAEAIDFLDFYGREAIRYGGPQPLTPVPGEDIEMRYIPLGPSLVIPPWNFPLAILCGMTTAAWVSGNTVVMKPSSDSPGIGWQYFKILQDIGLPEGVVNYMPGAGAQAGDFLVQHPGTRLIAFTGSMEVGLQINQGAAAPRENQVWIKRTILEMGGKDAIVVDSEADLDAAAQGVMVSAFGYQGQKCSACSRCIVVEDVYDTFIEKLIPLVEQITVGAPEDPGNFMGAVINESAMNDHLEYIEIGNQEGRLLTGGARDTEAGDGFFIQPTVFADIDPEARLAQEEVFGPVLAIIKANDYDHALEIANNTMFGLTGAIYTLNPDKIKKGKDVFHAGNLYINRKCTGALVGGHPFGGFNMSGTDSKAGGRDYLFLFTQPKSIAEKV